MRDDDARINRRLMARHRLGASRTADRDGERRAPSRRAALASRAAIVAAALAGLAACLIANWPGHFPPDAIAQLAQGRAGVFNLWHPPVMAWLLGLADRTSPGVGAFMAADASLFFAALAAFGLAGGGRWAAAVAIAAIAASPLALIYQGLVVKDVLFADAAVAGFAAIAVAERLWRRPWLRWAAVATALALFVVAALARQNGPVAAVIGALTLASVVAGDALPGQRLRDFTFAGLASLAVIGAAAGGATIWFGRHSDGQPERAREWQALQLYDLAGAVKADPAMPLHVLQTHAPATERFLRAVAPAFDPARIATNLQAGAWRAALARPDPWVAAQWRHFLLASPAAYLAHRAQVFGEVFATPNIGACAPVLVGVDPGDPAMLKKAGLTARETDQDDWDGDYASSFLGTPVFSHLAYAAVALVLLVLACRDIDRGEPGSTAVAGLIVAALAFTASFFVISIACDYRYLYFLDVAALLSALYLALDAPQWLGTTDSARRSDD